VLAICPVYQSEPSAAANGSCGCEPFVGTGHSLKETLTCASAAGSRPPARIGRPSNSSAASAADRIDLDFHMGKSRTDMVNEMLDGSGSGTCSDVTTARPVCPGLRINGAMPSCTM